MIANEFDHSPVPPQQLQPARYFAASYAGEHVAGHRVCDRRGVRGLGRLGRGRYPRPVNRQHPGGAHLGAGMRAGRGEYPADPVRLPGKDRRARLYQDLQRHQRHPVLHPGGFHDHRLRLCDQDPVRRGAADAMVSHRPGLHHRGPGRGGRGGDPGGAGFQTPGAVCRRGGALDDHHVPGRRHRRHPAAGPGGGHGAACP